MSGGEEGQEGVWKRMLICMTLVYFGNLVVRWKKERKLEQTAVWEGRHERWKQTRVCECSAVVSWKSLSEIND